MAWLLDLDGVVWLAGEAIPGSVEAVARLRAAGQRVIFVTNNSNAVIAEQEAALARIGIDAAGAVLTSAMAAATLIEPGATVHVAGGPGVVEAVEHRGAHVGADASAVIVGLHREFDYERLRVASDLVRRGARLIGTNDDATYPTPDGVIPGGGAILAAVACASGVEPIVAGKPFEPMVSLVLSTAGDGPHVMVGDRASTDGAFAERLGATFAHVGTGVTKDAPYRDLAAAVDSLRR